MDSLITGAAPAVAVGDPLGALKRVALRDDAPALALRGIAIAQPVRAWQLSARSCGTAALPQPWIHTGSWLRTKPPWLRGPWLLWPSAHQTAHRMTQAIENMAERAGFEPGLSSEINNLEGGECPIKPLKRERSDRLHTLDSTRYWTLNGR
jgi:hypothetical protein